MRIFFLSMLLLTSGASCCAQTLKIYEVKLKARQITGLDKFGSGKSGHKEILTGDWIVKNLDDYTEAIGGYTDNPSSHTPRDLFNMSTFKRKYEFLDEIDMDYYESKGFDKMKRKNPTIISEPLFEQFYKAFINAPTPAEKKAVIINDAYDKYRWLLLDSRLEFTPKSTFQLTQGQQTKYTLKLKADIKTEIKSIDAAVALKIDGYINSLVDKAIKLEGAFLAVSFDNSYVTFLSNYISDANHNYLKPDMFIQNLDKYISSREARLITEIGVLTIDGSYDKSLISDKSIAYELTAKFDIPQAQATQVALSISATIQTKKTINFNSNFSGAFIISILTDMSLDRLEYSKLQNATSLLTTELLKAIDSVKKEEPLVDLRLNDGTEVVFDGEHKIEMEIKRVSDLSKVTFVVEIPQHITWGKQLCFFKNGELNFFDCTGEVKDNFKSTEKSFTRDQLNDKTFVEMKKVGFVGRWDSLTKKEFTTEQIMGTKITFRWLED